MPPWVDLNPGLFISPLVCGQWRERVSFGWSCRCRGRSAPFPQDALGSVLRVCERVVRGGQPVEDGHVIADLNGPCFQTFEAEIRAPAAGTPMHNPFGRLKLVSIKDIAGQN
jgi:hypothetical protein